MIRWFLKYSNQGQWENYWNSCALQLQIYKHACANRPNKSDFIIWPNFFYQLSVAFKNCDNLALELNNRHDQKTMAMMPPFSLSLSTGIVCHQPLQQPYSLSLPIVCNMLILWWRWRFGFFSWGSDSFLLSLDQEVYVVAIKNGQ